MRKTEKIDKKTEGREGEKEGKTEFPFTSGKNKYDFIDVNEMSQDIAHIAQQDNVQGVINICTGNPISLGEKVESFIKEKGYNIKLAYGKFPDREYDSPAIWGNPNKVNKVRTMFGGK